MRLRLGGFARYRPRVLTVILLAAIVAAIWLADSIEDYRLRKYHSTARPPPQSELQFNVEEASEANFRGISDQNLSFGWPFLWRQYVVELTMATGPFIVAQSYSPVRLAGNLAIWLVLLAAPAGACEWQLRRYRPGWRFSLRTLFVVTGLAAAFCAWFAVVRNRAAVQEPLIAYVKAHGGTVWGEQWGPRWFDQIGADRYCRRILSMGVKARRLDKHYHYVNNNEVPGLLSDLRRLPDLQYLSLEVAELTPETIGALSQAQRLETLEIDINEMTPEEGEALAEALGGLRHLRVLSMSGMTVLNDDVPRACLAAAGSLAQLEHLRLSGWFFAGEDLRLLAGLTNLKSLTMDDVDFGPDPPESATLLASLPPLPRLEALDLRDTELVDGDLQYIARLSRLKSLNLSGIFITGAALADLTPLETLEELTIDARSVDSAGLSALAELKGLKKLHIDSIDEEAWQSAYALSDALGLSIEEAEACLRAHAALRNANPRLVIDIVDDEAISLFADLSAPKGESISAYSQAEFHRQMVQAWKDKQAGKAKLQGAANSTPAK